MRYYPPKKIMLAPQDRVLFLTKDLNLIKEQLYNNLNLHIRDLNHKDLLDNINTDIMTPAWVCFYYDPKEIAQRAYAGLLYKNQRVFSKGILGPGKFKAIVSGQNKGTGSSRETAAQCEFFNNINLIFAGSFAPIHRKNNINLGQVMGSYDLLARLQDGEEISLEEFLAPLDPLEQKIIRAGGLFKYLELKQTTTQHNSKLNNNNSQPMTMAQKIMSKKTNNLQDMLSHKNIISQVDRGYSHEFTSAQVHEFLKINFGENYEIKNSQNFAAFEDHLIYADQVAKFKPFLKLIQKLRDVQKLFITKNNLQDYSAQNNISPGICHEVARQDFILPGDFILATDSHTCMGGALNSYAYGIGATEYAALLKTGQAVVNIPSSVRFELIGNLKSNCSAKDVILYILANYAKTGVTLDKILEFGGSGLNNLSIDERATLCNMATECGAKTGICEPDNKLVNWLLSHRKNISKIQLEKLLSWPDPGCKYAQEPIIINLDLLLPMAAHPGDPDRGIASDPTNGIKIKNLKNIPINIAYGGSCTAGKFDDISMYAEVCLWAQKNNLTLAPHITFYIQYGSQKVAQFSHKQGYDGLFKKLGVKIIPPGCGACIGCGPGVSTSEEQITISAINRNFQGRSGPGKLYLASPYTVAASAFAGVITEFNP